MSRPAIPRPVIMLGLVSLLTDASSEMIYPLVPLFVATLGSGPVVLGIMEGVAETTAAMLKLFSGVVSDRVGKRKLLVVLGYGLSSFIRPFTGAVGAAWQIILVRMLDRVGKGIRTAPRDALLAAAVEPSIRGRAYGFHRSMDHAGAVVGPLLAVGALLTLTSGVGVTSVEHALRGAFFLSAIPGALAVLTLLFLVHEPPAAAPTGKVLELSLKKVDRNFLVYLGTVSLFTLGNSSDAFLLFRVEEAIHASGTLEHWVDAVPWVGPMVRNLGDASAQRMLRDALFLPLVWAFFHVIKVGFATPLGALSDRVGRKRVILTGWAIYAGVYTCFAFLDRLSGSTQLAATFLLFAVYALFYAFTEGAEKALVADLSPPDRRGAAFGLFHFSVGLTALPASVLFGVLYGTLGAPVAFGTGAALATAAMLLLATLVREQA